MRSNARMKSCLALIAATVALGVGAAPVKATDPVFVLVPSPNPPNPLIPPPTGKFNGPCGLIVDAAGNFYVSDYYHNAVDAFSRGGTFVRQLANVDPADGPCGLALDSSGKLYVNNYHRNVVPYTPSVYPASNVTIWTEGPVIDSAHPTGVAVDATTGRVYVNVRTHIAVYESTGTPVMDGPEPLKIGLGTLGEGYGLAISAFTGSEKFPSTNGYIYVPDALTNTVKVYNPVVDKVNPVAEIKDPFGKAFVSLRDSTVAVDRVSGEVYFVDNLQPSYTEKPQAVIYVYTAANGLKGRLKYKIVDALPAGLAVDNTDEKVPGNTQGRVYVTSGNTDQAGVYAYPPGAATTAAPLPPSFGLTVSTTGIGVGTITSSLGAIECADSCGDQIRSGAHVSLTATPDPDSAFSGWSGDCSGTAPTCTLTMDEAASVSAEFTEKPQSTPPIVTSPSSAAVAATAPEQRTSRRKARCRRSAKRRHRSAQRRRACRRHRSTSRR